ncbi:hypothetical protein T265_03402 [Opisthorchis viverrini]|uniref:Serine/threonine-protein phosphatase PGAM5, mitochondrial n=1 Tax=Opisthorchis viverrini TaxID=6198 RepID=A0A075A3N9_OPIVI|nr:hypothetical protein T265_03402 [Opisthorchis viverrini]KER30145.1 hypothetical protein T265_03402 [Opisthorchis viverrini]
MAEWLGREFTDRKICGSNPTCASRLPLSRLGQPGSIHVSFGSSDGVPPTRNHTMNFTKLPLAAGGLLFSAVLVKRNWKPANTSEDTSPESAQSTIAIKPWDNSWDIRNALPAVEHIGSEPYSKVLILIRHGQYNLKGPTPDEKVLTKIGWQQAYEAGRQLKRTGVRIDRIVHSDLIRARQTTAALLAGLQDDSDSLFDLPLLTNLAAPRCDGLDGDYALDSRSVGRDGTISSMNSTHMISRPYRPFPEAEFDCQQSRFLAEGPPPVAPEPPTRSSTTEAVRQTEGPRLEQGFQTHVHRVPVTPTGQLAHAATRRQFQSWSRCCTCLLSIRPGCSCACHRIHNGDPCETVVFVGHANVFRFWLCRALQLPPEAWLRFQLYHGSISCLVITYEPQRRIASRIGLSDADSAGRCTVSAVRIGEVGHLEKHLLSS